MMNNFKNLCSLLFVFALFLILSKECSADALYSQTTSNGYVVMPQISSANSNYKVVQLFYNYASSTIQSVDLSVCKIIPFTSSYAADLAVYKITTGGSCPSLDDLLNGVSGVPVACMSSPVLGWNDTYTNENTKIPTCGSPTTINFTSNTGGITTHNLVANTLYAITMRIAGNPTAADYMRLGNYSVNIFGDYTGEEMQHGSSTETVLNQTTSDLFFAVNGIGGRYSYDYSITINRPEATSTKLLDFGSWGTQITTPATTTPLYSQINFWNVNTPTSIIINKTIIPKTGAILNFSQPKIGALSDGYYQAQAFIKDNGLAGYNQHNLATSSIISFTIDSVNGVATFPDIPTASSTVLEHLCDNVATSSGSTFDDFRYGIECGARKLMYWLIYPSDTMTTELNSTYTELKGTFPFSAYYGLTDAINTAVASTTTNSSDVIQMPFIDKNSHFTMITVMSSSSLPNLIGSSNAAIFRNTLKFILWALTAFLIYIQFKKI